ncbi:hypothetical protein QPK13_22780 [Photorhabdus tasmaniensis]
MSVTSVLKEDHVKSSFTNVENQFSYRHVDFSIELLLSSGDDSQLEYLFLKTAAEVRQDLQARYERGERYVTTDTCDNFSELVGCMGHDC